jgi:prolipoprotein diacylglyceryl transferase
VIWDIDPKLPWHAAFVLAELAFLSFLVSRWREQRKLSIPALVGLALAGGVHVYYALELAAEHPLVGPYPLPWHGVLVLAELAAIGFAVWYWRKHGKLTGDALSWLLIAVAAHAFYTLKLADDHPTFDLEVRWYGVFFAIGLLGAARAFPVYFERWGFKRKHGEELCLWTAIGMLLGAHFVHLVFYETESLIRNPIRIFQLGSGLASHGGGLGAIIAVIWFARRKGLSWQRILHYMDPAMCAATWVIPWVRVGNFFNSEIVGRAWDGPLAVAFPRHEARESFGFACRAMIENGTYTRDACLEALDRAGQELVTRHPSQAYEAILAFIMVGLAVYLQRRWRNRLRPGAIIFILLGYYFTTRFGIEYLKELQAPTDTYTLTMGQKLSLPIVLVSLYMLFFSKTSNIRGTIADAPGPATLPDDDPANPAFVEGAPAAASSAPSGSKQAAAPTTKKKKKKRA